MKKIIAIILTTFLCMSLVCTNVFAEAKAFNTKANSQKSTETKAVNSKKAVKVVTTQAVCEVTNDEISDNEEDDSDTVQVDETKGKKKKVVENQTLDETEKQAVENNVNNKGQSRKLEERIKVQGTNLKFEVPPVIKEGRILIPVRAIMNGLDADVAWDGEEKTVTIIREEKVIILNLSTGETSVNGEPVISDVPAQTICNRTFVPLRFIAQTLGENVDYDKETGDIDIGDEDTTGDTSDEE